MFSLRSTVRLSARNFSVVRPQASQSIGFQQKTRGFSTQAEQGEPKSKPNASGGGLGGPIAFAVVAGVAGAGYYFYDKQQAVVDYGEVRKAIADVLDDLDYDDGSYGPVFVRLAWHASGTYDKASGTGGSNGAGMRFAPESTDGANAGLDVARARLEPIKKKFPGISYGDLWTLAGAVAIEEMGGPVIPWKSGRVDSADNSKCPPNGRLPDAAQGAQHIRDVFYRMGFGDREIVALLSAHALGRCHTTRSGFDGPWTRSPTTYSNEYFKELTSKKWTKRKWAGPHQFADPTGELMMLPTDIAFLGDKSFRSFVDLYVKDEDAMRADFAAAFGKLMANGVPGQ